MRAATPAAATKSMSAAASGSAASRRSGSRVRPTSATFRYPNWRARCAIALIEIGEGDWWTRLGDDPDLNIIDGLLGEGGRGSALAVGRLSPDRLGEDRSFAVLEQAELANRLGRGEAVLPIAVSGNLNLCVIERVTPLSRAAA